VQSRSIVDFGSIGKGVSAGTAVTCELWFKQLSSTLQSGGLAATRVSPSRRSAPPQPGGLGPGSVPNLLGNEVQVIIDQHDVGHFAVAKLSRGGMSNAAILSIAARPIQPAEYIFREIGRSADCIGSRFQFTCDRLKVEPARVFSRTIAKCVGGCRENPGNFRG
jgi:hypothetical protein